MSIYTYLNISCTVRVFILIELEADRPRVRETDELS